MAHVEAGRVWIGSPSTEAGRDEDEGPMVELDIASFDIDRTPVTVDAFEAWSTTESVHHGERLWWTEAETPREWVGKCNIGSIRRDHPVNCVTWSAARAMCRHRGADLPTEAEWEKAARAGSRTPYAWGNEMHEQIVSSVQCGTRGCGRGTAAVVREGPRRNAWGVCDLAGNVWEWTLTQYSDRLGVSSDRLPTEPLSNPVIRGGAWLDVESKLFRAAHRGLSYPEHGLTGVGFRCVRRHRRP